MKKVNANGAVVISGDHERTRLEDGLVQPCHSSTLWEGGGDFIPCKELPTR